MTVTGWVSAGACVDHVGRQRDRDGLAGDLGDVERVVVHTASTVAELLGQPRRNDACDGDIGEAQQAELVEGNRQGDRGLGRRFDEGATRQDRGDPADTCPCRARRCTSMPRRAERRACSTRFQPDAVAARVGLRRQRAELESHDVVDHRKEVIIELGAVVVRLDRRACPWLARARPATRSDRACS